MDAATLQSKLYLGYSKAATRIGNECTVYRPTVAVGNVIDPSNIIGTVFASYNAMDMQYGKPNLYGKDTWYGLFDATNYNVGDYLVSTDGTFFIAAKPTILPILAVKCTRTISINRSDVVHQTGAIGYGGGDEVTIQGPTPCSILYGERGVGEADPSDVRNSIATIVFPYFSGVTVGVSDIIVDDLSRRYAVNSAELTDLGWRVIVEEVFISKQNAIGSLASTLR